MQLRPGTTLTGASGTTYVVRSYVSFGGQADVYRAAVVGGASDGDDVAIKIYKDEWLEVDPSIMTRVRELVDERYHESLGLVEFVWPKDVIESDGLHGFAMPFVPPTHVLLEQMLESDDPAFPYAVEKLPLRTVTKLGAMLADAFNRLHSDGIAYRDLNPRNLFVDPKTPALAILDTDQSVANDMRVNIAGVAGYRAPELFGTSYPTSASDRYSLAVIFFRLLLVGHPLHGARTLGDIEDTGYQRAIYCERPLFIFHPSDASNAPVPGEHEFPIALWPALPQFMRELFTRSFTTGLFSPGRRVLENEWLPAFLRLHNAIATCAATDCRLENFVDVRERQHACYACGAPLPGRWRIENERVSIVLEPGLTLTRSHFDWEAARESDDRIALVVERDEPLGTGLRAVGLRNLGPAPWRARRAPGGDVETIASGKVLRLGNFGHVAFGPHEPFAALIAPESEVVA